MTISHPPTHAPMRTTRDAPAAQAVGLADEHGQLLRQVAIRADALLAAAASGDWPAGELHALLGYLSTEVLRQAADEEAFLFPYRAGSGASRLARDHVRLRSGIEALQRAADGGSLDVLARVTRDLLIQLEHHLAAEEAILAGPDGTGSTPATAALGGHLHEWYPLTEGPVIDLDALPRDQAAKATLDRVLRLHHGELVELQSSRDPDPAWRRIDEFAPGRYGFVYLEDGPNRWRVQVTRREHE